MLSQARGNRQTGQRAFAIELHAPKDGKTDGTILVPFGLKLDAGAILKLDDKDLRQGLRFSTCVPQGCLLPVSFPTPATDAMMTATTLTVAASSISESDATAARRHHRRVALANPIEVLRFFTRRQDAAKGGYGIGSTNAARPPLDGPGGQRT